MATEAFTTGNFPTELNATAVVLIPKVDAPQTISEFHPTFFCNVALQDSFQVIMNCIKSFLHKLVSPCQVSSTSYLGQYFRGPRNYSLSP